MEIYKITNIINNKIYIGKDVKSRNNYYGSGTLIKRAIKKYGIENFQKEIIEVCDDYNLLSELEIKWIKFYDSTNLDTGYNLTNGGDGGNTYKNKTPEELAIIKSKISKNATENNSMSGRTVHSVWVSKFGIIEADRLLKEMYGKRSDTFKKKSKEELDKINKSKGRCGVKKTKQTCDLISKKAKGRYINHKWIRKENISKRVPPEQLNDYLLNGWVKGRIFKSKK